jgi:hypothetical protein
MRRKSLFFLVAFLATGSACLAQDSAAPVSRSNALFLELLGNGGVYSVNYERMWNDHLGLRIGYGIWNSPILFEGTAPDQYQTVPVSVSYLLGSGERKLEFGGGVTLGRGTFDRDQYDRRDFSFRSLTAIVGYRSHPPGRGYLFRAGVTPFYSFDDGDEAYPDPGFTLSAGVSFGYRF